MASRFTFLRAQPPFLALVISAMAPPLAAQTVTRGGVLPAGAPTSANADLLTRHLRELASNPENLGALTGAGAAALAVGDANAALAFFARAERLSPRNGQIKAGLGRALLKAENPRDALRLFDDATDLGVADAEVAGDRGLAHDLRGEARRAQKDYALALASRGDDEITRRYALSLAISGDRDQALKLLDPLLYKRDQAAWRARAFVLALTGDMPEANKIVRTMMPAGMAQAMTPFLTRLAALRPAEKALAVHLGQFPSDGSRSAPVRTAEVVASPPPAPTPIAAGRTTDRLMPATDSLGTRLAVATTPPPATIVAKPIVAPPKPMPAPVQMATVVPPRPAIVKPATAAAGPPDGTRAPVQMTPSARAGILADIISKIEIPETELIASAAASPPPTTRKLAQIRKAAADPKLASTAVKPGSVKAKPKPPPKPIEPKHPARVWVQVAGGANKADLAKSWTGLRSKAATALKGRSAWTTPLRSTNRLLTGPFADAKQAQAFVNQIGKAGVSAFVFTSAEGQAIDPVSVK